MLEPQLIMDIFCYMSFLNPICIIYWQNNQVLPETGTPTL